MKPRYLEWAELNRKLKSARYNLKFLTSYPLSIRIQDEPRIERKATDAEVEDWIQKAQREVNDLEAQMATIEQEDAAGLWHPISERPPKEDFYLVTGLPAPLKHEGPVECWFFHEE